MKWIGPSTDEEIIKYSKEKKGLIIVPVAFVSEHSETLVELDIEYKKLAMKKMGVAFLKSASFRRKKILIKLACLNLKPEERRILSSLVNL